MSWLDVAIGIEAHEWFEEFMASSGGSLDSTLDGIILCTSVVLIGSALVLGGLWMYYRIMEWRNRR